MNSAKGIPVRLYHKIVGVILITSMIPLVWLSVFTLYTFNTEYTRMINHQYTSEIEKSASALNYYLENFITILELRDGNGTYEKRTRMQRLLSESGNDREKRIHELLGEIAGENEMIKNCVLIEEDETVTAYSKNGYRMADPRRFLNMNSFTGVNSYKNEIIFEDMHDTPYYDGGNESVCTIGRKIEGVNPAVLYLEIDPSAFDYVFSDKELYGKGYLRVIGEDGAVIYQREQDVDRRAASIAANLQQLIYSQNVPEKGLMISFSVDKVTVMADVYVLRGIMILVILCCLTMILVVSSHFSKQLTDPIHKMIGEMNKLRQGDFNVKLQVSSQDEIGVLSESFNEMSEQLQMHINRSYVAQLKEKEAELTALKSQIYPHFLYNTLEVIRMTAYDENDEKVATMIEALSDQMHYIIGTAKDVVPLRMEVDGLRKYLWLINCRYEGKVIFEVNADGLMEYLIPKLILQPIVENAFFHGLKPKQGEGVIQLMAEEEEDKLMITILDNGVGMKPEEKRHLEELLESDRPGNKEEYNWQSIGLKNVHDRLRYLYGMQYGITISSHEGMGTAVCAVIPKDLEDK